MPSVEVWIVDNGTTTRGDDVQREVTYQPEVLTNYFIIFFLWQTELAWNAKRSCSRVPTLLIFSHDLFYSEKVSHCDNLDNALINLKEQCFPNINTLFFVEVSVDNCQGNKIYEIGGKAKKKSHMFIYLRHHWLLRVIILIVNNNYIGNNGGYSNKE